MIRLIASTLALTLVFFIWPTRAQAFSSNQPTELVVRVGSHLGITRIIKLNRNALWCTELQGDHPVKKHLARPTHEQWTQFRSQLNAINFSRWKKAYLNPDVSDGTQWSVQIRYPNLAVESVGSNNFPDHNGRPNRSPEETLSFQRFRASFSILDKECHL